MDVTKQEMLGGGRSGTCNLHGLQPVLHDPAQLSPVVQTHTPSNLAFRAEQKIQVKSSKLSCLPLATCNFITTSHRRAEPVTYRSLPLVPTAPYLLIAFQQGRATTAFFRASGCMKQVKCK